MQHEHDVEAPSPDPVEDLGDTEGPVVGPVNDEEGDDDKADEEGGTTDADEECLVVPKPDDVIV